jgi:hypothetical protein
VAVHNVRGDYPTGRKSSAILMTIHQGLAECTVIMPSSAKLRRYAEVAWKLVKQQQGSDRIMWAQLAQHWDNAADRMVVLIYSNALAPSDCAKRRDPTSKVQSRPHLQGPLASETRSRWSSQDSQRYPGVTSANGQRYRRKSGRPFPEGSSRRAPAHF